jgi:hypothetical protein
MAVSSSPFGPWERFDQPIMAPSGTEQERRSSLTLPFFAVLSIFRFFALLRRVSLALLSILAMLCCHSLDF